MRWIGGMVAMVASVALASGGQARGLPQGARYVAIGSSYAAGPGVGEPVPNEPARCGRSALSYPRVLAARLRLRLVDVSCSGATTANVLGPWNELAPQLDGLTSDTKLVTITIGGNDVRFVGNLFAGVCALKGSGPAMRNCPVFTPPAESEWTVLTEAMTRIGREVRRRSPRALVIFVNYPSIVPPQGTCVALGVSEDNAAAARATAARLASVTALAARRSGARLLAASAVTRGHDVCSPAPWSLGALTRPGGVPMHPTVPAHAAIADALQSMIERNHR